MFEYKREDGEYVMVDDHGNTLWRGPEIAIAFGYNPKDKDIRGSLHKHGDPKTVKQWADTARSALRKEMFGEMILITGPIPIEEINRMISTTGYVGVWYEKEHLEGGK